MMPTRPGVLLALALGFGALTYLLAVLAYGSLPQLPPYAPVSIVLLAVVELAKAKVGRDRLAHRGDRRSRPRHPMQVARAAVLPGHGPVAALLGRVDRTGARRRDDLALVP